jgi:hypothetical protein
MDFIIQHQDKVNWEYVSHFQTLTEAFIREFAHKVDWYWIAESQRLSEAFIYEFIYKFNLKHISWTQQLSEGFIRKHKTKSRLELHQPQATIIKEVHYRVRGLYRLEGTQSWTTAFVIIHP